MAVGTWREANPQGPNGPAATVREHSNSEGEIRGVRSVLQLPSALADRWNVQRELTSRGAEADLILVVNEAGERRVAKIYRAGIEPKTEVLERVGGTSFEHVVRLFEHGQSDGRWYELLEYVEHGSLEDLIQAEGPKLPEARVRDVLDELVKAIHHLHRHEVVHRDIKPSNILVRTVEPLDLVLTDFGIASVLGQQSRRFTTGNRTIAYAAPETAAGEVSQAADWWSLGIMLVEMLTGRHPFAAAHAGEMMNDQAIMSRLFQMPVDRLVEGVVDPWRTLCRGLLRREATNRWASGEIGRWLGGDATLSVTDEAAPGREFPPFFFAGQRYSDLTDIAHAFGENWAEARKAVERGHLLNWVKDDLRDNEWRQYLSDLDRDHNDLDERVFRIIAKADQTSAPTFCGYRLDPEGLRRLANDSLANTDASRSILARLLDRNMLLTAAEISNNASLRAVHEAWRTQLDSYRTQAGAVVRAGAPQEAVNHGLEQARAAMLLSVLPGGDRYIGDLRALAQRAAKPELLECPWFQAMGNPSSAGPPAAFFLINLLAPHAEGPAAEARRIRAQAEAEARAVRNRFFFRLALVGVALAGVVAWLLWYNSPANVLARQQEQRRADMQRQEQENQRREQERLRQDQIRREAQEKEKRNQEEQRQRMAHHFDNVLVCPDRWGEIISMSTERILQICSPAGKCTSGPFFQYRVRCRNGAVFDAPDVYAANGSRNFPKVYARNGALVLELGYENGRLVSWQAPQGYAGLPNGSRVLRNGQVITDNR